MMVPDITSLNSRFLALEYSVFMVVLVKPEGKK